MHVTLDKYGRIVVPKPVRDRLGISEGTDLVVEIEEGRLVLRPVPESVLEERDGLLVSTADVPPGVDVRAVLEGVRARARSRSRFLPTRWLSSSQP
jgi:AbrB family looped-hinge helix DNA binding protein